MISLAALLFGPAGDHDDAILGDTRPNGAARRLDAHRARLTEQRTAQLRALGQDQ